MTSQQRLGFDEKVQFLLNAEVIYNKHLKECAASEVANCKNWIDWLREISTSDEERNKLAAAFRTEHAKQYFEAI